MGDQKDITDMSFEEFFSEDKTKAEREENRKAASRKQNGEAPKGSRGFIGSAPKLSYNSGEFTLYIPRYRGLESDQFFAAVEKGEDIVPLRRIKHGKRKGETGTDTLNLTDAGVTPLEDFTVTIDGEKIFENKAQPITYYNSMGTQVTWPMGETTVICKAGSRLKLFKAEITETSEKNGLAVFKVMFYVSGSVKIDNSEPQSEPEQDVPAEKAEVSEPAKEAKKETKPAKKKVTVKASLELSRSSQDADAVYDGKKLPLYASYPAATLDVKGCEPQECTVRIAGKDGEISVSDASAHMSLGTGDYGGPVTVTIEKGAKILASADYFIIPGFSCSYAGKGDITEDTKVSYNVFGEEGVRDAADEDSYSFEHDGMQFQIIWCVPVVTIDMGDGPKPFSDMDVDVLSLGDKMTVTVRGAKKKAVFFSGSKGKKRDVTPGWEGDSYDIDLKPICDEILSAPSASYCFYITVNSCPNRKFITVTNPVRVSAYYQTGCVVTRIDPSRNTYVCRLYKIDKSVEEVPIIVDNFNVPVSADVIEAEVAEIYNGEVLTSIAVPVRQLPFLLKDQMGDKWMYVSRSKRIPLPGDLFNADGKPNVQAIKAWHERIVRMNPELRGVTLEMIQKAFRDFA